MKVNVKIRTKALTQVGNIQMDSNNQEWVIVAITHAGLSRVKRNSIAHLVHAKYSPEIAKSVIIEEVKEFQEA